jgi:hypothetical protein
MPTIKKTNLEIQNDILEIKRYSKGENHIGVSVKRLNQYLKYPKEFTEIYKKDNPKVLAEILDELKTAEEDYNRINSLKPKKVEKRKVENKETKKTTKKKKIKVMRKTIKNRK